MKKFIWISLLSLSRVILAACGSAERTAPAVADAEAEAGAPVETAQEEVASPDSTATRRIL